MKKCVFCATVLLALVQASIAQKKKIFNETPEQKQQRMAWWTNDRFGLFIHWGLYALPARHEWVRHYERIKDADYQKYFNLFDPDLFDAREWARMAKAAGMKYAVLTTKHHEGFCLFDSRYTDFKATNTPAKRDLVKEFVDAFRAEGIKIGFYYSLIDWHHPDYTIDNTHPLRPSNVKEYDEHSWKSKKQLLVLLIESISKGGNLLLNVGPTARGYFDERAVNALTAIGAWMKLNSRSVYGCTQAPVAFKKPDNCLLTYNPASKRLYVHLVDYPLQKLSLPGYKARVKYAQFLHDGSEIKFMEGEGYGFKQDRNAGELNLSLPVTKPNIEIPVVELILNDE